MHTNLRLPRATGADPVVIPAAVWNRIADAIEKGDRITVSPPLMMREGPYGRVFSVIPDPIPLLLPSSNATPGGMYNAKLMQGPPRPISTSASTINDTDVATSPLVEDCYAVNAQEIGQTGHMLILDGSVSPTLFTGWYSGSADDGKPVYVIDAIQGEDCSRTP